MLVIQLTPRTIHGNNVAYAAINGGPRNGGPSSSNADSGSSSYSDGYKEH